MLQTEKCVALSLSERAAKQKTKFGRRDDIQ